MIMKKVARILMTIVFAVMALTISAQGMLKVTGDGVRLRAKPGGADTGLRMYKNQQLQWLNYNNGWYAVKYKNNVYYISSKYVTRISQEQNQAKVVITGDRVIMRNAPGGKDSGLRVNNGDRFSYCGQSGDWYKILYKGNYYWVSKKYSKLIQ